MSDLLEILDDLEDQDRLNAITLLAALDLEKSKLVFDEDRLDRLDY